MPWRIKYNTDQRQRQCWVPFRMPRWQDNLIDSVFYLYRTPEEAKEGANSGACGFLVSVPWDHPKASPSSRHIYAVSNYHAAVRGGSVIRLNTKEGKSGIIETEPTEWFWRSGSDVAIYRIDGSVHFTAQTIWQYAHVDFNEVNCTANVLREFHLGPGDDVFSVGRFLDIHGIQQNTPLIRSGIIASRGLISIRTDSSVPWDKEECWIVEMRSRTGFSGSPVYAFIPPWQPNFIDAEARKYGNFFFGPWLLGIQSSQIPGDGDARSAGAGMAAVVPCSALESLLMQDEKVREERAAYEDRFVDAPTAISESSAPPTTDENPRHKEDFNSLLDAAVKGRKRGGRTSDDG